MAGCWIYYAQKTKPPQFAVGPTTSIFMLSIIAGAAALPGAFVPDTPKYVKGKCCLSY